MVLAKSVKKSEFALKYAIQETTWVAPRYLVDGVKWLAAIDISGTANFALVHGADGVTIAALAAETVEKPTAAEAEK
jgi:putative ATP-dependent endonuclease of OLD family